MQGLAPAILTYPEATRNILVAIASTSAVMARLRPIDVVRITGALDAVCAFGGKLVSDSTGLSLGIAHHAAGPRGVFHDSVAV